MASKPEWFPLAPVAAVFHRWLDKQDWDRYQTAGGNNFRREEREISPVNRMAFMSGVSEDMIWKVKAGSRPYIDFDMADRIVCAIDPFLWHVDEGLAAAYQEFDLARLDRARPLTERMAA